MNKHLGLFIVLAIGLALLAGCGIYSDKNSAGETGKTVIEPVSSHSEKMPGWEPTSYETVNNFDGVVMNIKDGTASPTGLTVVFANKSRSHCIFGDYYCLEKEVNESWYQVPVVFDGNYSFHDIAYNLDPGGNREWAVDWGWLYGSLNAGEYRIVKDILDFRGPGNFDTYYLAAEFTIKSN